MTKDVAKRPSKYDELNDKAWLREKYVEEDLTIYEIADLVGCGQATVNRHLARHGIERDRHRKITDSRLTDEEWLRTEYVKKRRSAADIGDEIDYTAKYVLKWLRRHGIETRTGSETTWYPELADPDLLQGLYIKQGLSLSEVAERIGCSPKGVHNALIRHGLITPDESRAHRSVGYCSFYTNGYGYEVWAVPVNRRQTTVHVHQLLVIAEGADPHDVFSGEYDCHHKSRIPWDNRPGNVELVTHSKHAQIHRREDSA